MKRSIGALLVVLLLLSFGLRAHRIGEQRVWWDEGWSVWAARFPVADILRETGNDVHPPLYFALLHGWREISGCLLYTSDAADERSSVDLGGRRIIKKKRPRYVR